MAKPKAAPRAETPRLLEALLKSSGLSDEVPLPLLWPLPPAEEEELEDDEGLEPVALLGMVWFEEAVETEPAEEACLYNQYVYTMPGFLAWDCETSNTDRRCSVAAGDWSSVKRHVSVQASALVAALLVRVAGARLVAVLDVDSLRRLVVGAPAFLVLEDGVGEFALAVVVAEAEGLVDVLS